jgi:hypothetical protein
LYRQINYKAQEKMGFDINYNKFLNHGIELRFFDWFPEDKLYTILRFIVHLLDYAESCKTVSNYTKIDMWNNIAYKALLDGKDAILTCEEIIWIRKQFNIKCIIKEHNIVKVFEKIQSCLQEKYGYTGPVSKYMLEKPSFFKKFFSCT